MDRRTFVGTLTAGIFSAPFGVTAQTVSTTRRIGVLDPGASATQAAEFQQEYEPLRRLGWVVGQNLLVERRYANGRAELLKPLAEELVRLKVEIIVTRGTVTTLAAKNVTTTIPIVIHSSGDPVRAGLVSSLARPGGNITGFSIIGPEIDAKRLALLRELLPGLQRVGVLEDSNNPYFRTARADFERICQSIGIQPIFVEVAAAAKLDNAIAEIARQRAQALLISRGGLYWDNRVTIVSAAMRHALPTTAAHIDFLDAGVLIAYGNTLAEQYQRQAAFVDRILRGAKPADLPVEQPTLFDLGINLKTAKALGIVVPQSLLLQATEVIR
jgi:putative tryptophan/tyrosine transport system substrate-binding protein